MFSLLGLLGVALGVMFLLPNPAHAQTPADRWNQVILTNYFRQGDFTCIEPPNDGTPGIDMPGPSVRGIAVDKDLDLVFVARLDGHVSAIKWSTGKFVWDIDFVDQVPAGIQPFPEKTRAFKILMDNANVYVAMTDVESYLGKQQPEGILALDKH